jgi:uncharacterized protein (TIGR04255 family)
MPIYENAPITEALIDIKVVLPPTTTVESLQALSKLLGDSYPDVKARKQWQVLLGNPEEGEAVKDSSSAIDGYIFTSKDSKYVVQSRLDGFTLSRLKPYEKWESFYAEFLNVWKQYRASVKPDSVVRIAVRYINAIEMQEASFIMKDFFTGVPEVPAQLPQQVLDFFSRTTILFAEDDVKVITSIGLGASASPFPVFVLDIDAFKEGLSLEPESAEFYKSLERLREIKDQVFENHLTEKTKGRF